MSKHGSGLRDGRAEGQVAARDIVPPERFPLCIVWTPIPVVTWIMPFVGHMGVGDSRGLLHDFLGHGTINTGRLGFGSPARYLRVGDGKTLSLPDDAGKTWDDAVRLSVEDFKTEDYSFFTNNCHTFVGAVLSRARCGGRTKWDMARLAVLVALFGRHVGVWGVAKTWVPWGCVMGVGVYFGGLWCAVAWLGLCLVLAAYAVSYESFCTTRWL
ncbi:unnamed protein product [Pedinophyceae sp. YPF-701]|nr:unnamed protein product [Pedinophyceae sp. YPF-701]